MKFETKYNVGDKVWFRGNNIELYIKEHPYKEPQQILKSCFHEGYVYKIKVEIGGILDNKPLISYIISNKRLNKGDDPEYGALLENCSDALAESEQDVFSNFDEVTNMIKEIHKNVLNGLKMMAEKILKNY